MNSLTHTFQRINGVIPQKSKSLFQQLRFLQRFSTFTSSSPISSSQATPEPHPESVSSVPIEKHSHVEVFYSDSNDIYYNLALEQYLFTQNLIVPRLMLWKNSPAVIIGKYQNQWQECNMVAIAEDNVPLVRRKSGGGTVYHDLGNICFSFMTPIYSKDIYPLDPRQYNVRILQNAMSSLGISTGLTKRKDLTLNSKKISGSAYQANMADKNGANKKCLHHGTLLVEADLKRLWRYLQPPRQKQIRSRAQESVVSKVCNITDVHATVSESDIYNAISQSFQQFFGVQELHSHTLKQSEMMNKQFISNEIAEMSSWQWLSGQTPKFENKISIPLNENAGNLSISLAHEAGFVKRIEFEFDDPLFYYSQIALNDILISEGQIQYDIQGICAAILRALDSSQSVTEFERNLIQESVIPVLPDLL